MIAAGAGGLIIAVWLLFFIGVLAVLPIILSASGSLREGTVKVFVRSRKSRILLSLAHHV